MTKYRPSSDLEEATGVTEKVTMQELNRVLSQDVERGCGGMRHQLVLLSGPDAGKVCEVSNGTVLGRGGEADLRVLDTTVSRNHAQIEVALQGDYLIKDLGSQNGTLVNGAQIDGPTHRLQVGDRIRLGLKTVVLFTRQDDVEDQLLELRKMESLGRLSRGVAHDFNNLLAGIMLNVNYIEALGLDDSPDPQETREALENAKLGIRQAASLTEQLLGYARRGRSDERPRDLSGILRDVVGLVRRTFPPNISVEADIAEDLAVVGDHSQLQQVFMNLAINARDAMPRGGSIAITARLEEPHPTDEDAGLPSWSKEPWVVVSVQDTGVGIDRESLLHIFEPFYTTKELGKGTGLGLATVYGVVKSHGGDVEVESAVDYGSCFRVFLPASQKPPAKAASPRRVEGHLDPRMHGAILLLEDDALLMEITKKTLERMGFHVYGCTACEEAVRIYDQMLPRISLVVMDMVLPGKGGIDTFSRLRDINPHGKIIVVSGYVEENQVRASIGGRIDGFLRKPCDAESLFNAICEALLEPEEDLMAKATLAYIKTSQ